MPVMRHMILSVLFLFLATGSVSAAEFVMLGPRAMGMGGAYVAVASDATAVHWNPAGLSAQYRSTDIRTQAGIFVKDHSEFADLWDDIDTILDGRSVTDEAFYTDETDVARLVEVLRTLNEEGTGIDLNGQAGVMFTANVKGTAMALGATGIGYATAIPELDLVHINASDPLTDSYSVFYNDSDIYLRGLETIEYGLTLARGFIGDSLHLGGTLKVIDAATYFYPISAFNTSDTNIVDELKKNKRTGQKATVDVGVIWRASERLRLGMVGKYLTAPSFESASGKDVEISPQFRAGAAYFPWRGATVALDVDVTTNETLTTGYDERLLALGLEQSLGTKGKVLSELFTVRAGVYKNMAESDSNLVTTAGIGLGVLGIRMDIAAAYDFEAEEAGASTNRGFSG